MAHIKAKHQPDPVPEVNSLEHVVETEATLEPSLPTSIENDLPATIEPHQDTTHQDEPDVIAEQGSSKVQLDADGTRGLEPQSELEQENLTSSAQGTGVDVLTAQKVETEEEARTQGMDAASTTNKFASLEFPETEQPVVPTTEVFIFCSCDAFTDPVLP